jgi:hypothetical protein
MVAQRTFTSLGDGKWQNNKGKVFTSLGDGEWQDEAGNLLLVASAMDRVHDTGWMFRQHWKEQPSRIRLGEKALRFECVPFSLTPGTTRAQNAYYDCDTRRIIRGEEGDPTKPGAGRKRHRPLLRERRAVARRFLAELLGDGPRLREAVLREAGKRGISRRDLYHAFKAKKVRRFRKCFRGDFYWALPDQTAPANVSRVLTVSVLEKILKDKPLPCAEVLRQARLNKIKRDRLYRAARDANVTFVRVPGPDGRPGRRHSYWLWPGQVLPPVHLVGGEVTQRAPIIDHAPPPAAVAAGACPTMPVAAREDKHERLADMNPFPVYVVNADEIRGEKTPAQTSPAQGSGTAVKDRLTIDLVTCSLVLDGKTHKGIDRVPLLILKALQDAGPGLSMTGADLLKQPGLKGKNITRELAKLDNHKKLRALVQGEAGDGYWLQLPPQPKCR